jgi:hypothetical protein
MKRRALLAHLRLCDCELLREVTPLGLVESGEQ